MKNAVLGLTCLAVGVSACGGGEEETPLDHALEDLCEHFGEATVSITAAASRSGTLAAANDLHTRYLVTLAAVSGGSGGFVQHNSSGGELVVGLSRDVGLTVRTAADATVPIEETVRSAPCAAVAVAYVLDLAPGIHTFEFSASSATSLEMVLVEMGGEAH